MSIDVEPIDIDLIADAFRDGLAECNTSAPAAAPEDLIEIGFTVSRVGDGVELSFDVDDDSPRRFTFPSEVEAAQFIRRMFTAVAAAAALRRRSGARPHPPRGARQSPASR